MEKQEKFEYGKELEQLSKAGDSIFKPGTGNYKLLFMDEPVPVVFHSEKDGKDIEQVKLSVRIDDGDVLKDWFVSKSKTTKGVFMQLMLVGANCGGLKGNSVTLIVNSQLEKGGAYKNTYTVLEALPFIKRFNEKK